MILQAKGLTKNYGDHTAVKGINLEFKKGSFKLAIDSEVRIIPITIIGTYDIQSKQSLKIHSGKNVKVIVDKPIDYKNLVNEFLYNEVYKNKE